MSLSTNMLNLATAIGTDVKSVRAMLNGNLSDLSTLNTTTKASLLAAINEVHASVETLSTAEGGATIDDASTSTSTVWSSGKTSGEIAAAVSALVAAAPGTLDTLNELAAALGDDPDYAATTAAALGTRVRFDAAQTLTAGEKTQALGNIGAATAAQGAKADAAVPGTRTINGKPLSANVSLTAADVGAATSAQGAKADAASQPGHAHSTEDLSDSSAVGRALVTAATAAAARAVIGAGTSSLEVGTTAGTAADAAAVGNTTADYVAAYVAAKS